MAGVAAWLERVGLTPDDLECGAHAPMDREAAQARVRAGDAPSALTNNCSGKHAGFLTTAQNLGEETAGYIMPGHAVQLNPVSPIRHQGPEDGVQFPVV